MDVKSENEDSLYGILFQETWVNFENYSPLSILSYCVLYNLGSQYDIMDESTGSPT